MRMCISECVVYSYQRSYLVAGLLQHSTHDYGHEHHPIQTIKLCRVSQPLGNVSWGKAIASKLLTRQGSSGQTPVCKKPIRRDIMLDEEHGGKRVFEASYLQKNFFSRCLVRLHPTSSHQGSFIVDRNILVLRLLVAKDSRAM